MLVPVATDDRTRRKHCCQRFEYYRDFAGKAARRTKRLLVVAPISSSCCSTIAALHLSRTSWRLDRTARELLRRLKVHLPVVGGLE